MLQNGAQGARSGTRRRLSAPPIHRTARRLVKWMGRDTRREREKRERAQSPQGVRGGSPMKRKQGGRGVGYLSPSAWLLPPLGNAG